MGHEEGAGKEKRPAEGFAVKTEAAGGGAGLQSRWEFGEPSAGREVRLSAGSPSH